MERPLSRKELGLDDFQLGQKTSYARIKEWLPSKRSNSKPCQKNRGPVTDPGLCL